MTLALLITAVGGAWAEDYTTVFELNGSTASVGKLTLGTSSVATGIVKIHENTDRIAGISISGTYNYEGGKYFTIAPETGSFKKGDKVSIAVCFNNSDVTKSAKAVIYSDDHETLLYTTAEGINGRTTNDDPVVEEYVLPQDASVLYIGRNGNANTFVTTLKVERPASAEPDTEVTTNAASEQDLFTTASFNMPAFDATVDYELVRDMSYKVAFSGVPTRARLAKDGEGKFHFADGLTFQLLDNIDAANPKDITSAEGITFMVGEVEAVDFEGNTFYQLNKATLVPLADFLADAHLGNYAICAVASTGEYDGSFSSGRIELFQGYEVEVAAKEFITYYKDEPLYVEDEAAELYTISSVNGDQAVLSDRSDAMPSNTPMLVYNKSNETKVILLIPCAEPDMAITVAPEFQGTLAGTTIAASTEGQTNYAFNGKQFVWVKDAITVGANKAWLSVNTGVPSARITLVFDEATGVNEVIGVKEVNDGSWYDLNGRKLNGMPTKKGVYILNGKKVVVK